MNSFPLALSDVAGIHGWSTSVPNTSPSTSHCLSLLAACAHCSGPAFRKQPLSDASAGFCTQLAGGRRLAKLNRESESVFGCATLDVGHIPMLIAFWNMPS